MWQSIVVIGKRLPKDWKSIDFLTAMFDVERSDLLFDANEGDRGEKEEDSQKTTMPLPPFLDVDEEDLRRAGYDKNKTSWTEEEDAVLMELRGQNMDWKEISQQIEGRNPKMCYSRYRRLKDSPKKYWKTAENLKLKHLIEEEKKTYREISHLFEDRTHKQLKEHYENYLRPEISHADWTLEEDLALVRLINAHREDWKAIVPQLPHRTENQMKNRFFGRYKSIADKKRMRGSKLKRILKASR